MQKSFAIVSQFSLLASYFLSQPNFLLHFFLYTTSSIEFSRENIVYMSVPSSSYCHDQMSSGILLLFKSERIEGNFIVSSGVPKSKSFSGWRRFYCAFIPIIYLYVFVRNKYHHSRVVQKFWFDTVGLFAIIIRSVVVNRTKFQRW